MNAKIVGLGCLCMACIVVLPAYSEEQAVSSYVYDNEQGVIPWKILLSHSNQEIPMIVDDEAMIHWGLLPVQQKDVSQGTCYPSGHSQTATHYAIKDLLAQQLAYLDQGTNKIIGGCFGNTEKECFIKITHHNDEDVFGFEIRFKTIQDKIIIDSLFCDITP